MINALLKPNVHQYIMMNTLLVLMLLVFTVVNILLNLSWNEHVTMNQYRQLYDQRI